MDPRGILSSVYTLALMCLLSSSISAAEFAPRVAWTVSSSEHAPIAQFGPCAVSPQSGDVIVSAANFSKAPGTTAEVSIVIYSSDGKRRQSHSLFRRTDKHYISKIDSLVFDLIATSDGGSLVFGAGEEARKYSVWKVSAKGDTEWTKPIGRDLGGTTFHKAHLANDGAIYIAGTREKDAVLLKIGPEGEELWEKRVGARDSSEGDDLIGEGNAQLAYRFHDIASSTDGSELFVAGQIMEINKFGLGKSKAWVVRFTDGGEVTNEWTTVGRLPRITGPLQGGAFVVVFDSSNDETTRHELLELDSKLSPSWRAEVALGTFWIARPDVGTLDDRHIGVVGTIDDAMRFYIIDRNGNTVAKMSSSLADRSLGGTWMNLKGGRAYVVIDQMRKVRDSTTPHPTQLLCITTAQDAP